MVKYRIKFKFEKENKPESDRDNILNDILSDIDSIVSDTPIRKPLEGETIIISNEEYLVNSVCISFEKEDEVTYYDFVVSLIRKYYKESLIQKESEIHKREYERILKEMMEKYNRESELKKRIKEYPPFRPNIPYDDNKYDKWFKVNKF